MIISHRTIEEIADTVTAEFSAFFYKDGEMSRRVMPLCTPIDQFASDYLKLNVSFESLSPDGSVCGLTAYEDTVYSCEMSGVRKLIPVKRNQVLLDTCFIQPGQVRKLCGRRRFTLAHECAHQILFQLESDENRAAFRKRYAEGACYSLRELKSREDWNEWHANALGAAILMPRGEVGLAAWRFFPGRRLVCVDGLFSFADRDILEMTAGIFGVSISALVIRLRHLGYIDDRSDNLAGEVTA